MPAQAASIGTGTDLLYLRSAALVVLAGLLWSMGGVLVKLVSYADAFQIVLYRSLFVVPVAAAFVVFHNRGRIGASLSSVGWSGMLGGLLLAIAFISFVTALTVTTVANASFVLGAVPLIAALLGLVLLGEPVRRSTWLAMTAAAVGVGLIAAPGLGPGRVLGTLLALVSAATFALFSIMLRRGRGVDTTPYLLIAALIAAAICAVVLVLDRGLTGLAISGNDLLACAAMGIIQIGCGLVAFTAGSRHLRAADLTLLAQTEVVLAPVWAWLIVDEVPALWTLIGGTLVLTGVTVQAVTGARRVAG